MSRSYILTPFLRSKFSHFSLFGFLPSITFALVLFLSTQNVYSSSQWQPIGPDGGDQFELKISPANPDTLFSISHHTIHRSTDAGLSWEPVHTADMSMGDFKALTFDPIDVNHLFVANTSHGVWHSRDQGNTWEQCSNGLPTMKDKKNLYYPVISLAFDANGRLFAGLAETRFAGLPPAWIYRSDDGGNSWTPDDNGIQTITPEINQKAKALLSVDGTGRLWAMVHGAGVYLYSEGTWLSRNGDLPIEALRCTYLCHDPQDSNHLLLGTEDFWVYETTDRGQSWISMSLPESLMSLETLPLVYTIALDPNNNQLIWVDANDAMGSIEQPLFKPQPHQISGAGSYISLNGGAEWMENRMDAFRITIDPHETIEDDIPTYGPISRSRIWYKTSGGYHSLKKSEDGARTFQKITTGLQSIFVNSIWLHPSPPAPYSKALFASAESGLYLQKDDQETWDHQSPVTNYLYTWSFAADYFDTNAIYYSTGNPAWSFVDERGIYRISLDCFGSGCPHGEQLLSDIGVWRVITTPTQPETIYAACQEEGIMVSYDGGQNWSTFNAGLDLPKSMTDIELDENGAPIYAAARTYNGNLTADPPQPWHPLPNEEGGVYRYDTEMAQWIQMPETTFATLDLELDPQDGQTLFAATVRGIYKTSDQGQTWEVVLPDVLVRDLVIDPHRLNYLYAATNDGVFRSTNGGEQWHDLSDGLLLKRVYSLALDHEAGILYAGTGGNSVFQFILDQNPQPAIAIYPESLDSGIVPVGFSLYTDIVITNEGEADLIINEITMADTSFSIPESHLPITVTPKSQITLTVRFAPTVLGVVETHITFHSNDPETPEFYYEVRGEGREAIEPILTIKANGETNALIVPKGTMINITVEVDSGDFSDQPAEWWAEAVTPFGTYWLISGAGWQPSETPLLGLEASITDIATPKPILRRVPPRGEYVLKFVVDNIINTMLDEVWVDTVTVIIE